MDELSLGPAPVVVDDFMARLVRSVASWASPSCWWSRAPPWHCDVADYSYVLENGRIVLDGDTARLPDHPDIQEFYLGQSSGKRRSYRDVKQYRRSRRWYG